MKKKKPPAKSPIQSWGVEALSPGSAKLLAGFSADPFAASVHAVVNGAPATCSPGPIAFLVMFSGYDLGKPGCAQVTVNGRHLPQSDWMNTRVRDGDDIKILPL